MTLHEHIKQAVFAAVELIAWEGKSAGMAEYSAARLTHHYSEAAKLWRSHPDERTEVTSVGWVVGDSATEAALLWLQEISLAVESLRDHAREAGPEFSEAEGHRMLREALAEWYAFDPHPAELGTLQMDAIARLNREAETAPKEPEAVTRTLKESDVEILQAAYELDAYEGVYLPSPTIIEHASRENAGKDMRRNLDRLKKAGLIATRHGSGISVTDAGVRYLRVRAQV